MLDYNATMEQVRMERARAYQLQLRVDELSREVTRLNKRIRSLTAKYKKLKEQHA